MSNFSLQDITRPNIQAMTAYSSARAEFKGVADVFLDANESPYLTGANRYPDPKQQELKEKLAIIKQVPIPNIFIGNGSDEVIDLLFRAFAEPGKNNVIVNTPSFGMYKVAAELNNVAFNEVQLTPQFELDAEGILNAINADTRMVFICSPNNPTGNVMSSKVIKTILSEFNGLVVVDEAYADFSDEKSWVTMLADYPNLVVVQTMSKAWGMAAARIGMAFASEEIVAILSKIKMPYNVSGINQKNALMRLTFAHEVQQEIQAIKDEREMIIPVLEKLNFIEKIYPSSANFLLVKVKDASKLYQYLIGKGIVVRDRSNQPLCENCLRFTVGLPEENELLMEALSEF